MTSNAILPISSSRSLHLDLDLADPYVEVLDLDRRIGDLEIMVADLAPNITDIDFRTSE